MSESPSRPPSSVRAAWIAGAYLVVSLVWIASSDQFGPALFSSYEAITRFQTYKGFGFVVVSAVLLFFAVRGAGAPRADTVAGARGLGVRMQLALLVLATALPLAALLAWNLAHETLRLRDAAVDSVRHAMQTGAQDLNRLLAASQRAAQVLVQRPLVRQMDPLQCDPLLGELSRLGGTAVEYRTLALDGRLVCGTSVAPAGADGWAPLLAAGQAAVVSAGFIDSVHGWAFATTYPITDGAGRLAGALQAVHPAAALLSVTQQALPEGGSILVADADGRVLARSPADGNVGRRLTQRPRRVAEARGSPQIAIGFDGVERLFMASRSPQTGWLVLAGVPVEQIYGPARASFVRSLLVALLLMALSGWLALRAARSVVRPLASLERAAHAAAEGRFDVRATEAGPAELAAVARSFNDMAERLPRLQHELELRQAEQRSLIEKLARNVPGVIFDFRRSPQGRYTMAFISDSVRIMYELEPRDLAVDAGVLFSRVHPEDQQKVFEAVEESARTLKPFLVEYRVMLPEAGERHYVSTADAERLPDGSVRWYGSAMDLTTLLHAQAALRDANTNLEERITERTAALSSANEALESFSYSVSHDLRAPLQAVQGFAAALREVVARGDAARAAHMSERILVNAERMNGMLEAFLALARVSRADTHEAEVDFARLVPDVIAEQPGAERALIEVAPDLPRVRGDAAMLRQVWVNLVSNALKYSSQRRQPVLQVGWTVEDDELVFHVRDNGAGFDAAYADKLFVPFQRLHKAEEFQGQGVGLALVRRILERHGGRIWAHSQVDRGATFSFSLPKSRRVP